jgi:hypothetical protein
MTSWYDAIVDGDDYVPTSMDDFGYDDDNEAEVAWGKFSDTWSDDVGLDGLVKSKNWYTWNALK